MVRWKMLSWFGKRKLLRFDSDARQHSYEVATEMLRDVERFEREMGWIK